MATNCLKPVTRTFPFFSGTNSFSDSYVFDSRTEYFVPNSSSTSNNFFRKCARKIPLEFGGLGGNLAHGHPNSGNQHWGIKTRVSNHIVTF